MSGGKKLRFIANARLKDIIGRGLINDDNIAIIELIKNSKDAGSPNVSIDFYESDTDDGESEIYIADHGSGMSLDDIEYKWLNIAYSEKKHSSPNLGAYAGSKGIGRFSCDRLGRTLDIYTRVKGGKFITLSLDWSDFEVDDRDIQIGHIETEARYISPHEFEEITGVDKFKMGTLLVIRDLRTTWTLDRLRSLRRELERFVIDPNQSFKVSLQHWNYDDNHEVNKPIQNKVFDDLDFRTTSILAHIDKSGEYLNLELRHDGDYVFKSKEKNPYGKLSSISIKLFFLNQPAKAFFKRRTGYHSVQYGSIFMFLNGFRVFPYGSEGDDWLGLDRRRQQGQQRFFGTRDLVGYVEITDRDDIFEPVSSREGVVKNQAFRELASSSNNVESSIDNLKVYGLLHKLTRKLEKFVVEGLDWDRINRSNVDDADLLSGNFEYLKSEKPVLETIDSIVTIRSPAKHIKDVEINLKYLSTLAEQEIEQYEELVDILESKFDGTSIDKLKPAEKRDLSKFISRSAKEIATKNKTNTELEKKKTQVEKALQTETKKRLFAEYQNSTDNERILQLHHQVNLIAGTIWKRLDQVTRRYRKDSDRYSKEELIEVIMGGLYELERIRSVAKLALKADFNLMTNRVNNEDLIQFIEEYLENYKDIHYALNLKVNFKNPDGVKLKRSFRPIEVTILIDNILVNAGKAEANRVDVVVMKTGKNVVLEFIDNGKGLTDKFEAHELFSKGISTTSGSGVGLSHAKQIVEAMNGKIEIKNGEHGGTVLKVGFK